MSTVFNIHNSCLIWLIKLLQKQLDALNMIHCYYFDGSVLDMADCQPHGCFPRFHSWSQHGSSITRLLSASAGTVLISSSLDDNCKVNWPSLLL